MVNNKSLSRFLSPCRNIQRVLKRGQVRYVPCGTCPDCLYKRSQRYSNLCNLESETAKYVVFVTLTYSEEYVPIMRLIQHYGHDNGSHDLIYCFDCTQRPVRKYDKNGFYLVDHYEHLSTYNSIIATIIPDREFRQFYNRAHPKADEKPLEVCQHRKQIKDRDFPFLRYCHFPDLQKFIKRLRFHASTRYNAEIRYYGCSEYGPETFRPHFHAILYFNSDKLAENIVSLVAQCWKFGRSDTEFARRRQTCTDYVSSYCNSLVTLPRYLRASAISPKSSHSRFLGASFNKSFRDVVYEAPNKALEEFTIAHSATSIKFLQFGSTLRALFPRCYNYDNLDSPRRSKLYKIYRYLQDIYFSNSPAELTKYVLINHEKYKYFLELLDIFYQYPPGRRLYPEDLHLKDSKTYECLFNVLYNCPLSKFAIDDSDAKIYNRVYSAIALSRHFFTFCCEHKTPDEVIELIDYFYSKKALYSLSEFYEHMIDYTKYVSPDVTPFYYSAKNYKESYRKSSYINMINRDKNMQYQRKIKHKEINDKNGVFLYPHEREDF